MQTPPKDSRLPLVARKRFGPSQKQKVFVIGLGEEEEQASNTEGQASDEEDEQTSDEEHSRMKQKKTDGNVCGKKYSTKSLPTKH